jgi:large subunit ribosomal protein L23
MNDHRLMQILLSPIVSEKSANAADQHNQYAFKVATDATKPEIKAAVELMFDVNVDSVTTSNSRGKVKRFGASMGKRSDWKKAFVRLKSGQEIDFMGAD